MRRLSLALAGLAGAVSAQDHVFPLGFGNASGPPTSSYPLARVKDANFDGTISPNEIGCIVCDVSQLDGGLNASPNGWCGTVRAVAWGYRYNDGFREEWRPDGVG